MDRVTLALFLHTLALASAFPRSIGRTETLLVPQTWQLSQLLPNVSETFPFKMSSINSYETGARFRVRDKRHDRLSWPKYQQEQPDIFFDEYRCEINERLTDNDEFCEPTCEHYNDVSTCVRSDLPKCVCADGFIRSEAIGLCIEEQYCPNV